VGDDVQVGVLVERVERDPQPEAFGQRDLLLDRLAGMDLLADALALEVLGEILGHQVAAVRGGVDQHVVGRGRDRAVEHDLQRLVARIAGVEGQVVAEDDEALWDARRSSSTISGRSVRSPWRSTSMTRRPSVLA
jgi:hypothetical protein